MYPTLTAYAFLRLVGHILLYIFKWLDQKNEMNDMFEFGDFEMNLTSWQKVKLCAHTQKGNVSP